MRGYLARALALVGLLLGPAPVPAWGADGRAEINTTAVGGTFPYVISQPGSYVLTGDLRVPDANTTAIEIAADDVTLDLNGFSISGVTVCTSTATDTMCSPTGTGVGIKISATATNVVVRNGTVRGIGSDGIGGRIMLPPTAGFGKRVEGVTVASNGGVGVNLGADATVAGSKASRNGLSGLSALRASVFSGNTTDDNGRSGVDATGLSVVLGNTATNNHIHGINTEGFACVVRGNTSNSSTERGIEAQFGSVITGNALRQNREFGIFCGDACMVRENTVETSALSGASSGLFAETGSTVLGNTSRLNGGIGIIVGGQSGYGENVASDNAGVEIDPASTAMPIGCNLADGTASCPACP